MTLHNSARRPNYIILANALEYIFHIVAVNPTFQILWQDADSLLFYTDLEELGRSTFPLNHGTHTGFPFAYYIVPFH